MSVGTAEGEHKAMKALENALNHPLLDEIYLQDAAGIIANFSGGEDLTFSEVTETLSYLHQAAGDNVEIIPGVINDSKLSNRAQVILIVTGLGAMPIEQAIPGAEVWLAEFSTQENKKEITHHTQPVQITGGDRNILQNGYSVSHAQINSMDLDVPAFLRKRLRG